MVVIALFGVRHRWIDLKGKSMERVKAGVLQGPYLDLGPNIFMQRYSVWKSENFALLGFQIWTSKNFFKYLKVFKKNNFVSRTTVLTNRICRLRNRFPKNTLSNHRSKISFDFLMKVASHDNNKIRFTITKFSQQTQIYFRFNDFFFPSITFANERVWMQW